MVSQPRLGGASAHAPPLHPPQPSRTAPATLASRAVLAALVTLVLAGPARAQETVLLPLPRAAQPVVTLAPGVTALAGGSLLAVIPHGAGSEVIEAALAAAKAGGAAPGRGGQEALPEDAEELILQVRLDRLVLAAALFAYRLGGRVYLPVGELAAALEFPIEELDGRAAGWVLAERRRFALDLAAGTVEADGVLAGLAPGAAFAYDGVLYARAAELAEWWPVDLAVDLPSLSLRVASREPLPIEQRAAREARRARLGGGADDAPQLPRLRQPYRLLDVPVLDVSLGAGVALGDGDPRYGADWNATAAGDLLWLNGQLFVAGDDADPLDTVRLTLGRRDPDGGLLGPLNATEFALLDVVTPGRSLIANGQAGRGAVVSNRPLALASEFDRITLTGDLAPGFEVELYRNEVLLDYQTSNAESRFEFRDVGLVVGLNELKLMFYGPQGQQREEIRRVYVGAGALRPAELHYRMALSEDNRALVDLAFDEAEEAVTTGSGLRALGEVDVGLLQDLSLAAAIAHLPLLDKRRTYLTTGLRGQYEGILGRGDVALDQDGGLAWLAGAQSRFGPAALSLEHAHYANGYVSEETGLGDTRLASRSTARIDSSLTRFEDLPPLSMALAGEWERRVDGRDEQAVGVRLASVVQRVAVANEVTWRETRGGLDRTTLDGAFRLSGRPLGWLPYDAPLAALARLSLRGEIDYALEPASRVESLDLAADLPLSDVEATLRLGLSQSFLGDRNRVWSASYNQRFDQLILGLGGSYSETGEGFLGVTLGFSMLQDPHSGFPVFLADRLSGAGTVAPVVFLDRDQDGLFGAKDEPIANAEFTLAGSGKRVQTDADGRAILTGLDPNRQGDLALREGSLEDPYWAVGHEGYGVVPRPGVIPELAFPVLPTGEVDGTVYLERDGGRREAANVALQLVGLKGELAQAVRSAYDGFYLFEKVLPGRYVLRVDPAQLERLALRAPVLAVEVTGEGEIIAGQDLVLTPR